LKPPWSTPISPASSICTRTSSSPSSTRASAARRERSGSAIERGDRHRGRAHHGAHRCEHHHREADAIERRRVVAERRDPHQADCQQRQGRAGRPREQQPAADRGPGQALGRTGLEGASRCVAVQPLDEQVCERAGEEAADQYLDGGLEREHIGRAEVDEEELDDHEAPEDGLDHRLTHRKAQRGLAFLRGRGALLAEPAL
jgi:hypothetical protein